MRERLYSLIVNRWLMFVCFGFFCLSVILHVCNSSVNDSAAVGSHSSAYGAHLANHLGEGSSLVLGHNHRWDQQGPLGPVWKLLGQTQDVLKHRGGAIPLNCEVLSAASPLHFQRQHHFTQNY